MFSPVSVTQFWGEGVGYFLSESCLWGEGSGTFYPHTVWGRGGGDPNQVTLPPPSLVWDDKDGAGGGER